MRHSVCIKMRKGNRQKGVEIINKIRKKGEGVKETKKRIAKKEGKIFLLM